MFGWISVPIKKYGIHDSLNTCSFETKEFMIRLQILWNPSLILREQSCPSTIDNLFPPPFRFMWNIGIVFQKLTHKQSPKLKNAALKIVDGVLVNNIGLVKGCSNSHISQEVMKFIWFLFPCVSDNEQTQEFQKAQRRDCKPHNNSSDTKLISLICRSLSSMKRTILSWKRQASRLPSIFRVGREGSFFRSCYAFQCRWRFREIWRWHLFASIFSWIGRSGNYEIPVRKWSYLEKRKATSDDESHGQKKTNRSPTCELSGFSVTW